MSGSKRSESAPLAPPVVAALADSRTRFLSFLERKTGDRAVAEEILQTALVRALERADDLRDPGRVEAWFYRVLRNAVTDHWRDRAAEHQRLAALAREPSARPGQAAERREICRCFEPLLDTLTPAQASILRRVDLEGTRPVDLAREDGITANNAMVRLHRARRALRDRLVAVCGVCAEHGCLDCACAGSRSESAATPGHDGCPGGGV